jgi:hypothetical protein
MPPAFPRRSCAKSGTVETGKSSRFSELRTQNFELRVTPVAHGLLVSLTFHAQEPRIHACSRTVMHNAG